MTSMTLPAGRSAGLPSSTLVIARRTVLKFLRTPQLIVVSTVQSATFLLIFRYVFGGAVSVGGLPYVDFLVPGFITTGVLFSGMGAAAGVAEDVAEGLFDRLRSLPIPRLSVLTGRALADTALLTLALATTTAIGFAIGFRIHGTVLQAIGAFGLCVVFGFTFDWVFIALGLFAGNAQAAQGMSLVVFPFTFISSAYVPVQSMPVWLRVIAEHQPVTPMVNAVRALTGGAPVRAMLGHDPATYVVQSLLWSAGIVIVFAPIAVARFRRG